MTAECKVPAAAVDVPAEGGCGVSGLFDYEYANATRHESKRNSESARESFRGRRRRVKDGQEIVGKREVKCFHISFKCALRVSVGSFKTLERTLSLSA